MPHDFSPTLSDLFLLASAVLALIFVVSFAVGGGWWRVRKYGWIGVMTFLHSLSVAALLFLIVWGIVFGQRVGEELRAPIAVFLAVALVAKIVILYDLRSRGRASRPMEKEKDDDPEQVPGGYAAGGDALPGRIPGGAHGRCHAD